MSAVSVLIYLVLWPWCGEWNANTHPAVVCMPSHVFKDICREWILKPCYERVCREAFTFTQQPANETPPFYWMLLVERESGGRQSRLNRHFSQPCENAASTHGSISVRVKGEPGRLALPHACLDWGRWKGVAALLSEGERHRLRRGWQRSCPSGLRKPHRRGFFELGHSRTHCYIESSFSAPTSLITRRGVMSPKVKWH